MIKFQSAYTEEEFARLAEQHKDDMQIAEPYSVTEVEITEDGKVWIIYMGGPGYMVTEGELELLEMLPEDKKKEVALKWRETRRRINRQEPYPHQWVE